MCSYDTILQLPHHVSTRRHGMSRHDRAAQFAPFAALVGHEDAIRETARLTQDKAELDEDRKAALDHTLQELLRDIRQQPNVIIQYFIPDKRKDGGEYATVSGYLQKIDVFSHLLILTDGTTIPVEQIMELQRDTVPWSDTLE